MARRPYHMGVPLALLLLGLSGCNQNGETPTPATPPTDAPEALVYGMADSPVFEALKSRIRMTYWDETQKVANFDLVILDGHGFGVQELKENELIHEAIRGGVWVLSLDVKADEKLQGIGHLLGAATPDESHAYLVRQTRSPNGHPSNDHVDFRNNQADAERTAGHILEYVSGKLQARQISPDQGPPAPPKGSLMWEYNIAQPHDVALPASNNVDLPKNSSQTASWVQSGTIRLYLANENNVYGDSQWVAIEQRGEANPNTLYRYYNNCRNAGGCPGPSLNGVGPSYEIAWPQTQFVTQAAIPAPFSLVSTSPSNVNEQDSVQTTSGFSIGVNIGEGLDGPEGGVSASYSYSTTTTRTISEWKVANLSVLTKGKSVATWAFASAGPWNGFNTDTQHTQDFGSITDPSLFIPSQVTVNDPNQLSLGDFAYATSSVWSSNAVSTDTVFIGGTDYAWYTDAWTIYWDPAGQVPSDYGVNRYDNTQQWGLNVDLGSVVPVPIASIDVGDNNTVTAGETATGTVTLAQPAYADSVIYLNSDSQFFTIPTETITIPKGSTTGTFHVETSNDGTCEDFGAKVQAFYTTGLRQEVQVVQPNPPRPRCS